MCGLKPVSCFGAEEDDDDTNDEQEYQVSIGWPSDVQHIAHVTFDRFKGFLGLPQDLEQHVPGRAPSASQSVFGVGPESMQCSYDDYGNSVPTILLLLQARLYNQGGLQAEGIFRVAAGNDHEEHVRSQLNNGILPTNIDVHALAGLIKAWFRELPDGVLDSLSHEDITSVVDADDEAGAMRLVETLSPARKSLLNWTVNLMADVVECEQQNLMNAHNIATVFAPNMFQVVDPITALVHATKVMKFLRLLITRRHRERLQVATALDGASANEGGSESDRTEAASTWFGREISGSVASDEGGEHEMAGKLSPMRSLSARRLDSMAETLPQGFKHETDDCLQEEESNRSRQPEGNDHLPTPALTGITSLDLPIAATYDATLLEGARRIAMKRSHEEVQSSIEWQAERDQPNGMCHRLPDPLEGGAGASPQPSGDPQISAQSGRGLAFDSAQTLDSTKRRDDRRVREPGGATNLGVQHPWVPYDKEKVALMDRKALEAPGSQHLWHQMFNRPSTVPDHGYLRELDDSPSGSSDLPVSDSASDSPLQGRADMWGKSANGLGVLGTAYDDELGRDLRVAAVVWKSMPAAIAREEAPPLAKAKSDFLDHLWKR